MKFFKLNLKFKTKKSDSELIARYESIVDKLRAYGYPHYPEIDEYQKLLEEMYRRHIRPSGKLIISSKSK